MGRVLIAGFLGSIVMYVVMSILHLSPVAQIGFRELGNNGQVLMALQTATGDKAGLYIYPGVDMNSKNAMAKMDAMREINPSGILIYQPAGAPGITPKLLATEYATELVQCLIAALLLSMTAIASYGGRVLFVSLLGVVCAITTNVSYWNWYSFPASYTLASMAIEIAGFIAAAFAIAALARTRAVVE